VEVSVMTTHRATQEQAQGRERSQLRLVAFCLASINRRTEDVGIVVVVVMELKLRNVERHILRAHLTDYDDNADLEDRPEETARRISGSSC
jgi:hypothetical protein